MLYFFRQTKNTLTAKAKKLLNFSSIHSHLIFGIHIWSCTAESNLKPLIIKQKMALRIMNDAAYNAHIEPLFKSCSILPLKNLAEYFKIQFMQKLLKDIYHLLLMMYGSLIVKEELVKIMWNCATMTTSTSLFQDLLLRRGNL